MSNNRNLIKDQEVAELLGVTRKRLIVKISEGKDPLPPYFKIPGSRERLWPESELLEWLEQYRVTSKKDAA